MDKIIKLESVAQFNTQRGQETLHPPVTVLDNSKSTTVQSKRTMPELYVIFLKDIKCAELKYGRSHYDYEEGTLVFIAPGQIYGIDDVEPVQPKGWTWCFILI